MGDAVKPDSRHPLSVVALIAAHNEADIIGPVIAHLVQQGLEIYFLDDQSTDGTVGVVETFLGHGVRAIERLDHGAADEPTNAFRWSRILQRKTELAQLLDADWFVHHDADEFRESPWHGQSLVDAIALVDRLGYNAIDFECLDFLPTTDDFVPGGDVQASFTRYQPTAIHNKLQIKCWKKCDGSVDLVSSGGHEAGFPGREVFPIRFILRHYPLRGQAHAERKIWQERVPRFVEEERVRGWHVQYDGATRGQSFLAETSTLTPYDPATLRVDLALRHRGVEALEQQARSLEAEVCHLVAVAAARDAAFQQQSEVLAESREQVADARRQIEVVSARFSKQLDELRAQCSEQRLTIAGLETEIGAFRHSLSWRCTAPLRWVYSLFTGR